MSREAIEHVTAAEKTVAQIRQDADGKIQEIKAARDKEIAKVKDEAKAEIKSFKQQERKRFEEELQNKIQMNKENIQSVALSYEQIYSKKQNKITDYIVKEVLRRYGN